MKQINKENKLDTLRPKVTIDDEKLTNLKNSTSLEVKKIDDSQTMDISAKALSVAGNVSSPQHKKDNQTGYNRMDNTKSKPLDLPAKFNQVVIINTFAP
ncbi:unnamed protein product [Urochloa humidicola]